MIEHDAFPGVCKVGSSKNPEKRLREFNISDPFRTYEFHDLKFFLKGYYEVEGLIHRTLGPVRLKGEWFRIPAEKASSLINRLHKHRKRKRP